MDLETLNILENCFEFDDNEIICHQEKLRSIKDKCPDKIQKNISSIDDETDARALYILQQVEYMKSQQELKKAS